MKRNIGTADGIVRIALALIFAALFFTNAVSGSAASALIIIAAIFLLTSVIGFCPIYRLLGLSTRKQ